MTSFIHWLEKWVQIVCANAKTTLICLLALTIGLSWYSAERFSMNSNLHDLIRQDAPWREAYDLFQAKFPMLVDNGVVVVSGESFGAVEQMSLQIEAKLKQHPEFFREVYSPANEPFFRDNALFYLDTNKLDEVATSIAKAQPILAAVSDEPSLTRLIHLVREGFENAEDNSFDTNAANVLLEKILTSGERAIVGEDADVNWIDEFIVLEEQQIRTILFKGKADFSQSLPNTKTIFEVRKLLADLEPVEGVFIGLTGEIVLSHEEVEAAFSGVKIAGYVSLALLLIILSVGVHNLVQIVATFVMLFVGVIWTSAWAMVSVGEFNTLSVVFVVMFFGLGVDFAIHFVLCFQESDEPVRQRALLISTRKIGSTVGLCTVTTAVGFLAYAPTEYRGLADLGIISAGGMVVACVLTFTLLPAILTLFGGSQSKARRSGRFSAFVLWLTQRRYSVLATSFIFVLGIGYFAKDTYFDYSVLALRDDSSGSMQALRKLNEGGQITNYTLNVVARDVNDKGLIQLSSVRSVISLKTLIPEGQVEKNGILEDFGFLLGDLFSKKIEPLGADPAEVLQAAEALLRVLPPGDLAERLVGITRSVSENAEYLEPWEQGIVAPLMRELQWLGRSIEPRSIQAKDLPSQVVRRFVGDSNEKLLVVIPEEDINDVAALSQFVRQVTGLHSAATGRPAIELGVGKIVQEAFVQSLFYALIGVTLVLLFTLRNIVHSLLIIVPLLLTSVCTLGVCVLVNVPLNMANVLVLPLIFGLGVDNGLHVVERFRKVGDVASLMRSSTPNAVMLSTLTTMGTFATLMLSPHQGTASIGFLLTVAIGFLVVFTIVLLPVLLSFTSQSLTDLEASEG